MLADLLVIHRRAAAHQYLYPINQLHRQNGFDLSLELTHVLELELRLLPAGVSRSHTLESAKIRQGMAAAIARPLGTHPLVD